MYAFKIEILIELDSENSEISKLQNIIKLV